ncbi:hypothetical protein ACHAWF_009986, partial [Thalassiosira exigua]
PPSFASPRPPRGRKAPPTSGGSVRSGSGGLEPEEYVVAPAVPPPPGPSPRAAGASPRVGGVAGSSPRIGASPRVGTVGYPSPRIGAAPSSGNSFGSADGGNRRRAHSTDSFGERGGTTNPFDDGADGNVGPSVEKVVHRRTNSGNWWREDIVDEGANKGEALEQYYGLNPREKRDIYGPPAAASAPPAGANPFDLEQPRSEVKSISDQRSNGLDDDIYKQAASSNHTGQYNSAAPATAASSLAVVDDYSFSNVNLSSPGKDHSGHNPNRPSYRWGPSTPGAETNGADGAKGFLAFKWLDNAFGGSSSSKNQDGGYLPPGITADTNIAPRSPRVSFENDFGPACFRNDKGKRYWARLSPAQRIGAGVIWVALLCTIFGVTVSEVKKANANRAVEERARAQAQAMLDLQAIPEPTYIPSSVPSSEPTGYPTARPTTPAPTRKPVTPSPTAQGNIQGYGGVHGKTYDGTAHPTRSPITAAPSKSPTPKPTAGPTAPPTLEPTDTPTVAIEATPVVPTDCNDEGGYYPNHLLNPKNCAWLHNGLEGHTDRKDKNCGGRPVLDEFTGSTVVYPATPLGLKCRRTCGLYNGCESFSVAGGVGNMRPWQGKGGKSPQVKSAGAHGCKDVPGTHSNQLGNLKTCEWLDLKEGQSVRKDMNCGTGENSITPLGRACPETCAAGGYEVDASCATQVSGGHVLRTYSSPLYSYSVNTPLKEPAVASSCVDGDGAYIDNKRLPKTCAWLAGEGHTDENIARHRRQKNCGADGHEATQLGKECPDTCRAYNDCGP